MDNPYITYAKMHAEGPIHKGVPPIPEFPACWYITSVDEAIRILKNPNFVHDRSKVSHAQPLDSFSGDALQFWQQVVDWPLFLDAPEHTEKRRLIAGYFRENAIADLEDRIFGIANELLDKVIEQDEFDAMWDFSYPLTLHVICMILGCQPPNTKWFKQQIIALANALDFKTKNQYTPALAAVAELNEFIEQQFMSQAGSLDKTLFNHFFQANQLIKDNSSLTSLFLQILFAGHETAADGIGNGLIALGNHPKVLKNLEIKQENLTKLANEVLRYDSSLQFSGIRTATQDYTIAGKTIHRGESVIIAFGACGHDPEKFVDPQQFDPQRNGDTDIIFGHGIHYCLGVHLAKLEMRIAFEVLLKRLPKHWKIKHIERRKNIVFRGPRVLTIQLQT